MTTLSVVATSSMPDFIVVTLNVFGVCGIEHKQDMCGQSAVQALHLVKWEIGPGRIIRISEEDDPRLRRYRFENRVHIGREFRFRDGNCFRAGAHRCDRVNQKTVRRVDRLVAIAEVGAREQIEQVIGACPADDPVGIKAESGADRFAQC